MKPTVTAESLWEHERVDGTRALMRLLFVKLTGRPWGWNRRNVPGKPGVPMRDDVSRYFTEVVINWPNWSGIRPPKSASLHPESGAVSFEWVERQSESRVVLYIPCDDVILVSQVVRNGSSIDSEIVGTDLSDLRESFLWLEGQKPDIWAKEKAAAARRRPGRAENL